MKKETKTKKVQKPVEKPQVEDISVEQLVEVKIAGFSGDFGREDINKLRDKVNEIIDYINQ